MAEPMPATCGDAVPENSVDAVIAQFNGNPSAALCAALDEIAFLRREIELARLATSSGFTRGWRPSQERTANIETQGSPL